MGDMGGGERINLFDFFIFSMKIGNFFEIFRTFYQNHARRILYGFWKFRNFESLKIIVSYNELWFPQGPHSYQYIRLWRWVKNSVKISHFSEIFRIFCQNHARRIFYEYGNFKIRIFWAILNLATIYDFSIARFAIDIFAFEDR